MTAASLLSIPETQIRELALAACLACGASPAMAASLAEATLSAEHAGRREVGLAHLIDYLQGLKEGRIDGKAEPLIERPFAAVIRADARQGIAQLAFDLAFDDLADAAKTQGIALFTQKNSYTAGELGYYVRRLAGQGLMALAFANAHAMMAPAPGAAKLFGTNPLAFGMPQEGDGNPIIIDQATSATAFVTIAKAAGEGRTIPEGWAVDADGNATTDPAEAILGALLPFGGYKGATMALMVEMLAAGLSGAHWSLDAGHFRAGSASPNSGLTVIALSPQAGGKGAVERASAQVRRLTEAGMHIPGQRRDQADRRDGTLEVDAAVIAAIRAFCS